MHLLRLKRITAALVACLCLAGGPALALEDVAHSKISFRTANGLLMNQGLGGSTFTLGGVNVSYMYFVNPTNALGLGYQADFDFQESTTPLSGIGFFWRWYFSGEGVPETQDTGIIGSVSRSLFSFYTGVEVARKEYFLGSNPVDAPSIEQNGNFFTIGTMLGSDIAISQNFEFNVEVNASLLAFSASDNRFFVRSVMLILGVSYMW